MANGRYFHHQYPAARTNRQFCSSYQYPAPSHHKASPQSLQLPGQRHQTQKLDQPHLPITQQVPLHHHHQQSQQQRQQQHGVAASYQYQAIPPPPASPHQAQHVIIQQKFVTVNKPDNRRSESRNLLKGIGRAVNYVTSMTQDLSKAKNSISKHVSNTFLNPMEHLKPGSTVQIVSKVSGKSLMILENGWLDCGGDVGTSSEFTVVPGDRTSAIKFRNVAQPHCYLAIIRGYAVGYGNGGVECDFIAMMTSDYHVTLESVAAPGSHIGVLPSGQLTDPTQTNKLTDAAHFRIKFLRNE